MNTHQEVPKVSIIFPIYNNENYLEQCIQSVILQTLEDIELILIDDGSTDNSPAICDAFAEKDARIRVVHKKNEGYSAGCNQGIEMAKGEYIAFVESDDFVTFDMYEKLYERAITTAADIVKCGFYNHFDDNDKEYKKLYIAKEYEVFEAKEHPEIYRYHASIWAGIYRRTFIDKYHLRFLMTPKATYSDFSWMAMTYGYAKRITILHKPLYYYTMDNPASSHFMYGEQYAYKLYHAREAVRILRQVGGYCDNVKEAIADQSFRLCVDAARYVAPSQRREVFDGLSRLCKDMFRGAFRYYYFNNKQKWLAKFISDKNFDGFYELLLVRFIMFELKEFKGKKVAVFGAGECGQSYVIQLKKQNISVTHWVDNHPKKEMGVELPDVLVNAEFDVVLISVLDQTTVEEIRRQLHSLSIPDEKIVWKMPLRVN